MKYIRSLLFIINLLFSKEITEKVKEKTKNYKRSNQQTSSIQLDIDTKFGICKVQNCWDTICAVDPQGKCDSYSCICNEGYYTYPVNAMAQCCYKQKSQLIVFLLEVFISFGIGHIYASNYNMGMTKLVTYSSICFLFYAAFIYRVWKDEKLGEENSIIIKFTNILSVLMCFCTYNIWQCIDILLIGTNYYVDGNGAPLKHW